MIETDLIFGEPLNLAVARVAAIMAITARPRSLQIIRFDPCPTGAGHAEVGQHDRLRVPVAHAGDAHLAIPAACRFGDSVL